MVYAVFPSAFFRVVFVSFLAQLQPEFVLFNSARILAMANFSRREAPTSINLPTRFPSVHLRKQFTVHPPVNPAEKETYTVLEEELNSPLADDQSVENQKQETWQRQPDNMWQPGFWNRFPWLGCCALLTVLLASASAVFVLLLSDGRPETRWSKLLPPNVILAGLNNVANIAIGIAVGQGIAIAWWRRSLKGATMKELHHTWSFSTGLGAVLLRFNYFNAVALAALTTKFTIIDGLLFQKASTALLEAAPVKTINMTSQAWTQFPFTGALNSDGTSTAFQMYSFTHDFVHLLDAMDGTMKGTFNGFTECEGLCMTNVTGVGFAIDCQETKSNVDYGETAISAYKTAAVNSTSNTTNPFLFQQYNDLPLFSVGYTQEWPSPQKDYSWISMNFTHIEPQGYDENAPDGHQADHEVHSVANGSCPSVLTKTTCELRPALINYPLTLQNISSEFLNVTEAFLGWNATANSYSAKYSPSDHQMHNFTVVKYLDLKEQPAPSQLTQLGGIQLALQISLGGAVSLSYGPNGWGAEQNGTLGSIRELERPEPFMCNWVYTNPMNYLLQQLNTLTFLLMNDPYVVNDDHVYDWEKTHGKVPGLKNITTSGPQFSDVITYRSRWPYLYGALASTLVCILCVSPSYWGFWELGREVSLSPFEIAAAMGTPMLGSSHGDSGHVNQVLRTAGSRRIQYGRMGNGLGFHESMR